MTERTETTRQIVREFLQTVRTGADPQAAGRFMAPVVDVHYVFAEKTVDTTRTPEQMTEHIHELRDAYGDFTLVIDELLADGDKAFVRWTQHGMHQGTIDGHAPTGHPITTSAHTVYRIEDGVIAEYWMQSDRLGQREQLR